VLSGGGRATLEGDDGEATLFVDDLVDPLQELAWATRDLLRGSQIASAEWVEVPGSWRWRPAREGEHISIRMIHMRDWFSRLPDERGEVVFQTTCRCADFAGQMTSELGRILRQHGMEG
jgi:hypothetical protein